LTKLAVIIFAFVGGLLLGLVGLVGLLAVLRGYREAFTRTAQHTLGEMFLFIDLQQLFHYNLGLLLVIPLLVAVAADSIPLAVAAFALVAFLPGFVYRHLRERRLRQFIAQLPDALMALASSLRAGSSMAISLEKLVEEQRPPLSQEFELFLREQRMGVDFDTALEHMAKRIVHADFQLVVAGMRISREVGGNLAGIMETQVDILRSKAMMEGKIRALTAQGKLQGLVMTFLPVALAGILYFMEPDAMSLLFTTHTGWMVLGVVAVMETLGYLAICRITAIDV
jgi:tight adherence protein B